MDIHHILSDYAVYDVEYGNQLTNHLPMGLVALAEMGATEERMREFAAEYLRSQSISHVSPSTLVIDTTNWTQYLGQHQHYAGYIVFFRQAFERDGREQVLRDYIDHLLTGVAGGAFHALIKLAYGLDADDDEEIIHALAYFCICHLPLPLPDDSPNTSAPLEVIKRLSQDLHFQEKQYTGPNIFSRMAEAAADPHYRGVGCRLAVAPEMLHTTLADLVRLLYANTYDFTMLHAVTSNHALRLVFPYVQNTTQAVLHYWNALLAAYLTIGCPKIDEHIQVARDGLPTWEELFHKAVQASDVHTIKFVYTCFREEQVYARDSYRVLAAEKLG